MLIPGQAYRTTITVKNTTNPPASVALAITKPDGTLVSPAPTPAGWVQAGTDMVNTYDYVLPAPGLYQFAWSTTGPATAAVPDFVNVRSYFSIISMAEARAHLNKTSTTSDDELAGFMMASTELVEAKVGPLVPRQFTDRVDQGRLQLVVVHRPIISVASVASIWPGGPSWDGSVLRWDADAGIVYQFQPFDFWWGPWDVTLTAGRPILQERWIHAAKEQLRHLWETQRGGQPPALLENEEEFTTAAGWTFSVPRRVLELLQEDMVPSS